MLHFEFKNWAEQKMTLLPRAARRVAKTFTSPLLCQVIFFLCLIIGG